MKDAQHLIDMYASPQKLAELVEADVQYATGGEYLLTPRDSDFRTLELRVAAALGIYP